MTAHLSMLVCCGHMQEDMVSLLPTVFIFSTDANVKPRCLTENPLDNVKMHDEQNYLYPLHRQKLGNTRMSDFMVRLKMPE